MGWKWYGAKTAYRIEVWDKHPRTGAPRRGSETLVEERVVLVKARGFEEARKKVEADALEYAKSINYANVTGERVRCRYLGAYSVYELSGDPESGAEVYSDTRLTPATVSDRTIADRMFSPEESERQWRKRFRFIQGWIVKKGADELGREPTSRLRGRKQQ